MNPSQSRELVVVFGGAGATAVGLLYAPAAVAVRAHGERLVDAILGTGRPADLAGLVGRLEQRAKLEQHVGVDRTLFGDLQAAVPVLAPLVAAAAVFLPK